MMNVDGHPQPAAPGRAAAYGAATVVITGIIAFLFFMLYLQVKALLPNTHLSAGDQGYGFLLLGLIFGTIVFTIFGAAAGALVGQTLFVGKHISLTEALMYGAVFSLATVSVPTVLSGRFGILFLLASLGADRDGAEDISYAAGTWLAVTLGILAWGVAIGFIVWTARFGNTGAYAPNWSNIGDFMRSFGPLQRIVIIGYGVLFVCVALSSVIVNVRYFGALRPREEQMQALQQQQATESRRRDAATRRDEAAERLAADRYFGIADISRNLATSYGINRGRLHELLLDDPNSSTRYEFTTFDGTSGFIDDDDLVRIPLHGERDGSKYLLKSVAAPRPYMPGEMNDGDLQIITKKILHEFTLGPKSNTCRIDGPEELAIDVPHIRVTQLICKDYYQKTEEIEKHLAVVDGRGAVVIIVAQNRIGGTYDAEFFRDAVEHVYATSAAHASGGRGSKGKR